jgi:hypothetical protein
VKESVVVVQEMMKQIAIVALLLGCAGCATILDGVVESTIDSVFETREEREVRRDTTRWKKGEPLQHHHSVDHLQSHREDMWFREWEMERYLDQLEEQDDQQRQIERMEEEREMWEQTKDAPIDTGLPNSP